MERVKYTADFKKKVISEFLLLRKDNPSLSLRQFAKQNHPEINHRLLYTWRKTYENEAGKEQNMAENEIRNKYGIEANELSMQEKFRIVMETARLSTEEFGEYCRKNGLYASDIKRWQSECEAVLSEHSTDKAVIQVTKTKNNEIKQLKQQVDSLKDTCKRQERELDKQYKSLAVYAAKVISLKNFHKLFTDEKEDL